MINEPMPSIGRTGAVLTPADFVGARSDGARREYRGEPEDKRFFFPVVTYRLFVLCVCTVTFFMISPWTANGVSQPCRGSRDVGSDKRCWESSGEGE